MSANILSYYLNELTESSVQALGFKVTVCHTHHLGRWTFLSLVSWCTITEGICDPFSWNEFNLKFSSLRYLHVSNLKVLLVILILWFWFWFWITFLLHFFIFLFLAVTRFWRLHVWWRPFWENQLESFHCALSSFSFTPQQQEV